MVSAINIIEEPTRSFNKKENLHSNNDLDIHLSSEKYKEKSPWTESRFANIVLQGHFTHKPKP